MTGVQKSFLNSKNEILKNVEAQKGSLDTEANKSYRGLKWLARSTNDKSLQIAYCDSIGLARANKSSKRLILTHIADSKTTELNFRYSKN